MVWRSSDVFHTIFLQELPQLLTRESGSIVRNSNFWQTQCCKRLPHHTDGSCCWGWCGQVHFHPLGMCIYHDQKHFPEEWSCIINMDSWLRFVWPWPYMHRCRRRWWFPIGLTCFTWLHTSPSLHLYRATTHILWQVPSYGLFLGEHRGAFVELKPFPWEVSCPAPPQHTPIFHTQHTPSPDVWPEFLLLTCSGVARIFVMPGLEVDAERLHLMAFGDCLHYS